MIRIHRMIHLGLSLSLAFLAASAAAEMRVASSDLNIGGQKKSVAGSEERFQEYRDLRDGFLINDILLRLEGETSPYFMNFKARNAARADESYKVRGGAYGKWDIAASYDRTPHNYYTGTMILGNAGTGRLTFSDQVTRSYLEANEQTRQDRGSLARTDATLEDSLQQAVIRDLISGADPMSFKLQRERSSLSLGLNLAPEVKTWVKVNHEKRDGARPMGSGTYERYFQPFPNNATTHFEDQFVLTGTELVEPIHYYTTTLNAGGGVYKKGWLADVEYNFTDFHNSDRTLRWANPFRTTDAGAKSELGANANSYDRSRFVEGQLSLPPSSQSHDVVLSGSVELPLHSRFTGSLSYGLINQRELLAPYTLNSAIAGVNGAPANVTTEGATPVQRFNGEIWTLTQSYALTSRPIDSLGASLKYRYYDYKNQSDRIAFPGYAGFGESYWRTTRNDSGAPVQNDAASYTRQTTTLGVDYQLAQPLNVEADLLWDRYDHKQQRIDGTDEVGAGTGFVYKPVKVASLKGSYHWAHRTVQNYKGGATKANPEAKGLANFNWADRIRQRTNLRAELTPAEALSFGFGGQYQDDAYGAGDRFGYKSQKNLMGSVDASYDLSENFSVSANYVRERRKGLIQNAAKDDAFNLAGALDDDFAADNFNPFNYWNTEITEDVDTIGFEATLRPIPEKVALNAGYEFSESRMRFDTWNPNAEGATAAGEDGAKLLNGAAQVWPVVVNRQHDLRVGGSYQMLKNLKVGLNYLFSWYQVNDFTNNASYLSGASGENTTKLVRIGDKHYDYTAHMVGTYLAYQF